MSSYSNESDFQRSLNDKHLQTDDAENVRAQYKNKSQAKTDASLVFVGKTAPDTPHPPVPTVELLGREQTSMHFLT